MPPLTDPDLIAVFNRFSNDIRPRLLDLRQLIFETSATLDGCGEVAESLKWGQPSYATINPKSGTPLRLGAPKSAPGCYALYVPCQTNLIETIRLTYHDEFRYEGKRALIIDPQKSPSKEAIIHCLEMAMMYYQR